MCESMRVCVFVLTSCCKSMHLAHWHSQFGKMNASGCVCACVCECLKTYLYLTGVRQESGIQFGIHNDLFEGPNDDTSLIIKKENNKKRLFCCFFSNPQVQA